MNDFFDLDAPLFRFLTRVADKHKEAAALKIEPPLQNGRADMSAIRRLFSFAVVR